MQAQAIAITLQPASQTVAAGASVTFSVGALDLLSLGCQWEKNGVPISGATSTSYTIASCQPSDAGTYTAVLTGLLGSLTSNGAVLTVDASAAAPVITLQPVSLDVSVGASATFTVASSGTGPLSCQWLLNGVAISGATSLSLTIPSCQIGNAGIYTAIVSNSAGSAMCNGAALTVNGSGSVSASGTAPVITLQPSSETVSAGASVTLNVAASGTGPMSCQWLLNGVAIQGATSLSLTIPSCQIGNAGIYTAIVSNSAGSTMCNGAVLAVSVAGSISGSASAPSITKQPASTTVSVGQSVTFSVGVSGVPAPTLQWCLNGTPIAGATSATLLLTGCTAANAGAYNCVVTNSGGSTTTGTATLTLSSATCPDRLVNMSVLTEINGTLTVGFVVGAGSSTSGSKTLLIRCSGPALTAFGVAKVMPDPQVAVFASAAAGPYEIASNAGWGGDGEISQAASFVGAFPISSPSSGDSAVLVTLDPGAYTVQASSVSGVSGNALVEVYEVP